MLLFWLPGVLFGLMDFHWIEFHSTPGRCIIWWNQISLQSTFLLHSLYNEMQKQGHCFLIACNTRGVFIHNQIAYANCSETSWSNTNDEWCLVNLESDDCQVTHFVGCFLRGNCHHLCHFHLLTSPAFDLCTTLTAALLATLLFYLRPTTCFMVLHFVVLADCIETSLNETWQRCIKPLILRYFVKFINFWQSLEVCLGKVHTIKSFRWFLMNFASCLSEI